MIINVEADARRLPIASGSVQACVTSPPYFGLRDYRAGGQIGLEPTPSDYVEALRDVFREVWRVLRNDGTLWLNLGDSYAGSSNGTGGATLKQSTNHGSFFKSDRRIKHDVKPKDLCGIPWRVAFALQSDGWYLRSDIIWAKPNPMPESVTDRPTRSHEYLFLLTKAPRYYYDADAISEPAVRAGSHESTSLGQYRAAAANVRPCGYALTDRHIIAERRNRRTVWNIQPEYNGAAHFAIFPQSLVEPCIRAGSRAGDLILDPFSGSGTVGRVAARLGRRFVGCDINPEYCRLAIERQTEVQVDLIL